MRAATRVRYGPASTEQTLGALPVVAGFCRRLDIAGIGECHVRRVRVSEDCERRPPP